MCGFIGIIGSDAPAVGQLYDGLIALQHRGQDAAGIATFDYRFHLKKGEGLVRDAFRQKNMDRLLGTCGVAHVRYPTVGAGTVEDAQPFIVHSPVGIAMAHNGNVTNYRAVKENLRAQRRRHVDSDCDVEIILNVFADELEIQLSKTPNGRDLTADVVFAAVSRVHREVQGAYSVVAYLAGYGMVCFRDPYGIKPAIMGTRAEPSGRNAWCFASESVALDLLGFSVTRDLLAGECVYVTDKGEMHARVLTPAPHRPCIFEWIYFARPDSIIDEMSVYRTQLLLGEALAQQILQAGIRIDAVIPVPDSARAASTGLAQKLRVPYREGFVKNRYIGRTFIMPGQEQRKAGLRHKLNAVRSEFDGRDVLIVDDSIVRGNTSKEIVAMARRAGARKVYLASYSAPIKHPCVYGIDMSTRKELLARERSDAEIAKEIGADMVFYQAVSDMNEAVRGAGGKVDAFCNACFTGKYPTPDVTEDVLLEIERDRAAVR
ncbi:MAG TPA: amidophosphoribosyltransferase [Planctomycetota bacterium]|nr:amidophosphoribosyltransferase [Planctomycetota bacterium]